MTRHAAFQAYQWCRENGRDPFDLEELQLAASVLAADPGAARSANALAALEARPPANDVTPQGEREAQGQREGDSK